MIRRAARRAAARDGRRQRDPRLLQRRRPVVRAGRRRSRTAATCGAQGADILDVGGESTRPGADRPSRRGGAAPRAARRRGALAAAGPWSRSTPCAPRSPPGPLAAGAAHRQRRQRRPGRPRRWRQWSRGRGRALHRDALARPQRATCSPGRVYDDVVGEVCRELSARAEQLLGAGDRRRSTSSSTRASASPSWRPTTGRLLRHLDQVVGLGHPRPRGHLAQGVPRDGSAWPRAARRGPRSSATSPPPRPRCTRPRLGCGACASTTCRPRWTRCASWPAMGEAP